MNIMPQDLMTLRDLRVQTFKERKDWENKGFKNEDMAQDVKVIMPALDLFSKTK